MYCVLLLSIAGWSLDVVLSQEIVLEEDDQTPELNQAVKSGSVVDGSEAVSKESVVKPKQTTGRASQQPRTFRMLAQRFAIETLIIVCLHIVALHMYFGKKENEDIAIKWYRATKELFDSQFTVVKVGEEHILPRGWNRFECFATGRRNCVYCLTKIECLPRQCPWMYWGLCNLIPAWDSVELEIPLDAMESFIFAIARRQSLKTIQKEHEDIAGCACLKPRKDLSSELCVLADNSEIVEKLLIPEMVRLLNQSPETVRYLTISDEIPPQRRRNHKPVLRAQLLLPSGSTVAQLEEAITPALKMIFSLIDAVPFVKLSEKAKAETRKARQSLAKIRYQEQEEERAEMVAKKREEKAMAEEAKVERMTPEQQRKHEEKLAKKQLKAKQPRIKIK